MDLTDGGRLGGVMTTNLNIRGAQLGDAGRYTVVVSNTMGRVESAAGVLIVGTAAMRPAIDVSRSGPTGQGFRLVFHGQTGWRYAIEFSPDLAAWQERGTIDGTGNAVEYLDAGGAASPARFYRIKVK